MEDQPNVGSKDQPDVAKFAVVMGVSRTSEKFSVKPELVKGWISALVAEELPLFTKLRESILDSARKKGTMGAARHFGVSEEVVRRLVEERRTAEGVFETSTAERSLQTSEDLADMRKVASVGIQAGDSSAPDTVAEPDQDEPQPTKFLKDNEERKVQRKYSTEDKINAVREFVKHSNQSTAAKELNIPTVSLNRWRDKIKSSAFQDIHADNLYGADAKTHKDKFFLDLDASLYE